MACGDCGKSRKAGNQGDRLRQGNLRRREIIAGLFAKGKVEAAASHRLAQCYHASPCGRLCPWLKKAPGALAVQCYDPTKLEDEQTDLYPALEREDFHCPGGWF